MSDQQAQDRYEQVESVLELLLSKLQAEINAAAEKIGKPVIGKGSCVNAFLMGFDPSSKEEMLTTLTPEVLIGYAAILHRYIPAVMKLPGNENNNLMIHLSMLATANYVLGAAETVAGRDAINSLLRSVWAKKRHEETYAMREEIISYWKMNIDPKKSNEKAATDLKKIFPMSHRKLAEYVADAKKILRSASKK